MSARSRKHSRNASKVYQQLVSNSSTHFRADIEFHEKPRQVSFGSLLIGTILIIAFMNDTEDFTTAARKSLFGCLIAIVVYCILQTKDGLMIRPHPMVWRAVHGLYLGYFVLLVFFLILPPKAGITFLHDIFPDISGGSGAVFEMISKKAPAHLLPSDCEITPSNIWRQFTSIWFLAHVMGYWGKMCLYRDWQMCSTYSIGFEVVELSLVWLVPEFEECWWDSVFMDVLGANMIGMILGRWTLHYLSCRDYDWEPTNRNAHFWQHFKNLASKFTPFSWSDYHWPTDEKGWALTGLTWISSIVIEFNTFIILHGLVLRPSHWLHTARLILIGAQALQSVPEWYEYARGRTDRIGHNCWLMFIAMFLELFIGFRYGKGGRSYGDKTPPVDIIVSWSAFIVIYSMWLLISSYRGRKGLRRSPNWLLYMRLVAHLPLVLLTRRWVF